ncbi:hypothetical protein [Sphaerisporangium sp. TRM90804]|uniref:hypothetical protein n=1 Tax=Sphaerisporangium sp. TRM90804 TaxID=3031113 RepID=UPI00244C3FD7|nr:hypothetical protein [Sphaerisporangium sp. TRM90804]MDH2424813.1 hypothetical protein [Sphaerisporangium sp. TRM90804]
MDEERRRRLRRLGRAYRAAMDAEKKAREALAAEVLAALSAEEPVGEVAREAGFDREWVRRARIAEEKRLADEANKKNSLLSSNAAGLSPNAD